MPLDRYGVAIDDAVHEETTCISTAKEWLGRGRRGWEHHARYRPFGAGAMILRIAKRLSRVVNDSKESATLLLRGFIRSPEYLCSQMMAPFQATL